MKQKIRLLFIGIVTSVYTSYGQCNANFQKSQDPTCVNSQVTFVNTSDYGSNATFHWNFGSGATPSTSNAVSPPSVVYSSPGQKTIELRLYRNGNLCDIKRRNIDVVPQPNVSFTTTAPECTETGVNFTYTGDAVVSYQWDFGIGATPSSSFVKNPQGIVYNTSGIKTITLIVSNGFCSITHTQNITINAKPNVDFTSTAPQCTGLAVDFTNTGDLGMTYSWSFGNSASPATSSSSSPSGINYSTAGSKIVTLTSTNSSTGCASTKQKTININQTPSVSFVSNAPVCSGSNVSLSNTGSTGSEWIYNWDFGEDATPSVSSSENPSTVYANGGVKSISLTIQNGLCSNTITQNVVINQTPNVDFTSTAPQCTGLAVDFTNTGDLGMTYSWSFGNSASPATSSSSSPSGINYSTAGSKIVTLTSTNSSTGCASTKQKTININQTPSVSFISNAPVCSGSNVSLSNTGSTGSEWMYSWDFGEDALPSTSTSENPVISYTVGGTKTISFTISDGLCSNSTTGTINIFTKPIINAGADTTICANRSVLLGSSSNQNYTYNWFPSETLDNPNSPTPLASPIANITDYILTVSDLNNCQSIDTIKVTMLNPLIADAGIDEEICRNDQIQIGAALVEGQKYVWTPNVGLSDSTSPSPIATPDSTIEYTLNVSGFGCDVVSDKVTIVVHQLPKADAGKSDTITNGQSLQLEATGGIQYVWSNGYSLDNSSIYNPIATPEETTTYTVEVTDIYKCVNTDTVTITVLEPSLWIPSAFTPDNDGQNDVLYVRGRGINNFEFRIYNKWGQVIFVSNDINIGWNGKTHLTEELVSQGAYVYSVKGVKTDGKQINMQGLVNLIR